jgi:DNA polymerase-4
MSRTTVAQPDEHRPLAERRTILHVDLDAFFCSVEELRDPGLRGTPFVVGGTPQGRGVVCSASYAARAFGVRNAMSTAQALRLCPQLVIVPQRRGAYSDYSRRVMGMLRDYGRSFEQLSIDEAFVDATGLREEPLAMAMEVQARILDEYGLPASIGVAGSKLVAKMASGRAKPNGVLVVGAGEAATFLTTMDVGELWGIGKATSARLKAGGIITIGQLAQADPRSLRDIFGEHAEHVIERARGIDESPVSSERAAKTISSERTFARDVSQREVLRRELLAMSDEIAARLRTEGLFARCVQLKLRWPDFTTVTRQATLPTATQLEDEIFASVEPLWLAAWRPGARVRLLGVGVSELAPSAEQLNLFDFQRREQRSALAEVTDRLRAKYGDQAIGRASLRRKRTPKRTPRAR